MHITLHDKQFTPFIKAQEIETLVTSLAKEINNDLQGQNPLFLSILNGSFLFTADLVRKFEGDCMVSFIKTASYQGMESTGHVKQLIGLNEPITGRNVVIIEDIVDSGATIEYIYTELLKKEPFTLKIAALLLKPDAYKKNIKIDYVGKEIPDKFIVGYGLDYVGLGRNLKDIYVVTN
ncbi:MAG: hypoxanthine phosphoribosyltransferase [Bacteroidetes bacterium]|nr:hypoxanthine phosphoribosyltransferase [Bacteroidota bacterium]